MSGRDSREKRMEKAEIAGAGDRGPLWIEKEQPVES
jgi:hypothetical protein